MEEYKQNNNFVIQSSLKKAEIPSIDCALDNKKEREWLMIVKIGKKSFLEIKRRSKVITKLIVH